MRFLADENFPGAAVSALEKSGHDVSWVRTRVPGAGDAEVLALVSAEARVLLTFDKDFGERARALSFLRRRLVSSADATRE